MSDYFVIVDPGRKPQVPVVEGMDGKSAFLYFPRTGTRLTFELQFTQDGLDRFVLGPLTRRHAYACGGRIYACAPQTLLAREGAQEEPQDSAAQRVSAREWCKVFGITLAEHLTANRLAWNAIILSYRKK